VTPVAPKPLYLERASYRRRRLMDGARVLPVVGLVMVLLPALWPSGDLPATQSEAIYLFCVWAVLILVARLLARPLLLAAKGDSSPGTKGSAPGTAVPADPAAER
jgi:uncharacterized membrane protein